MVETDALGPWRRAGAQHILLNWKQQQSGHKDTCHLPSSPFTAFDKPLLPPPPAFPEHCCPGTAALALLVGAVLPPRNRSASTLQAILAVPFLIGLVVSIQVHTLSCPPLADFPASNLSKSPFSRLLPGSQHHF